ncbi:MAG TPA: hypothetical protein PK349_12845 [Candidatus Hydrogenedentes bacterium]|nr:hypothetical protein [Candidatus Hydrogenedentota bacterium]
MAFFPLFSWSSGRVARGADPPREERRGGRLSPDPVDRGPGAVALSGVSFRGRPRLDPLLSDPPPASAAPELLRLCRYLRDHYPDVSDAVWTWKRLCLSRPRVTLSPETPRGRRLIEALDARMASGEGLDQLLDMLYESLFTFGAAAVELVPGRARRGLGDVLPVDVTLLRFIRREGRLLPCRVGTGGEPEPLPPGRLLYLGLDRDGSSPYGRPMLAALPQYFRLQWQLFDDMGRAIRNAGWNRLHVRWVEGPERGDDPPAERAARVERNVRLLRDQLASMEADQNLVTTDNIDVRLLNGERRSPDFYDTQKAVEEQVITGLHMMPVLLGRNYGSTETYGTAQFEVVQRHAATVNNLVAGLLSRVYDIELALAGEQGRVRVVLPAGPSADPLKAEEVRQRRAETALRLLEAGLVSRDEARVLALGD